MFFMGAVDEDSKLDADKAKWVMRRAAGSLKPYRRKVIAAVGLITIWTFTVLAGPFLVSYAIDHGIINHDAGNLNKAVVAYVVVAIVSYIVYRLQIVLVGLICEG